MSHKESAKKSHMDKLARMCGGYTKKSSGGSTVKPKIVHRKHGGKVMKAEGGSAQMRLDKKPRKHRQDGGGMILNAEQRARQRMIDEAVRMRKAADTAPSPYSAEDRAKMNELVNSTAGREKGGKVTKGTYVGGHDSKADLIADKQLIKQPVGATIPEALALKAAYDSMKAELGRATTRAEMAEQALAERNAAADRLIHELSDSREKIAELEEQLTAPTPAPVDVSAAPTSQSKGSGKGSTKRGG